MDWSAIIQALASIWVATVATLALQTWKRESKARRQTDFLDALTDSLHDVIDLMEAPIEMVKFAKIAIQSHAESFPLDRRLRTPGAIACIERRGEKDSKQLGELLDKSMPALSRFRSLVVKGQVLGFTNYNDCRDSCALITWQYNRIQVFSQIIGQTDLYWENPKVQDTVDKALSLEAEDVKTSLQEQHVKFLEFVRTNYKTILG